MKALPGGPLGLAGREGLKRRWIGATGFGLAASIDIASEFIGLELKGARVAIQGFGAVGKHVAPFLTEQGCVLVAASDSQRMLARPSGLDVEALGVLKEARRLLRERDKGSKLAVEAIIDVVCDIWIPAARPDVLRAENAPRRRARMVAQGANIPCTREGEQALHARSVLPVPDFIANTGVICAVTEYRDNTQRAAFDYIDERIRANTRAALEESRREILPPRAATLQLTEKRVRAAMQTRRRR
jgi:glutamate dehydrogenase/leucine dehydrogenase